MPTPLPINKHEKNPLIQPKKDLDKIVSDNELDKYFADCQFLTFKDINDFLKIYSIIKNAEFFSLFNLSKKPKFINDLIRFNENSGVENQEAPLCIAALDCLDMILKHRIKRNSYNTRNAKSASSIIARHLSAMIDKTRLYSQPLKTESEERESSLRGFLNNLKNAFTFANTERSSQYKMLEEIKRQNLVYMANKSERSKQYIREVLYAVEGIIVNRDTISRTCFGKLYPGRKPPFFGLTQDKVPIHLEDYETKEAANRYLNDLVQQFIQTYNSAKSQNKVSVFFDKLVNRSVCLEGKLTPLFKWGVSLNNSDHPKLMDLFEQANREWLNYSQFMFEDATDDDQRDFMYNTLLNERCQGEAVKLGNLTVDASGGVITQNILDTCLPALLMLENQSSCLPFLKWFGYV
jgi:hypothetical protein